MKKLGLYEWSVILFFLIVPVIAILVNIFILKSNSSVSDIALKWFVFSGIGLRLGSAGLKQIINPKFTAVEIFKSKDSASAYIVRELGFSNVCFSVIAIISLFVQSFRIPAAIAGGLYFCLAGLMHVFKKKDSGKEIFAMFSDLFIFLVLLILIILNLI